MINSKGIVKLSFISCVSVILLSACGGAGGNSSVPDDKPAQISQQVIIDEMTTVPVINGSATKGTLYIHNYSDRTATNVSFRLNDETNVSKIKSALSLIGVTLNNATVNYEGFTLINPDACKIIQPGGSCAINFNTPNLKAGDRGSSLVGVRYSIGSDRLASNQVVNYSYVSLSALSGVNFTGDLTISASQGTTGYAVGYLYGGGAAGTKYTNVNLNSSMGNIRINNGFVNGQEVAAGQVIAVEYALPVQNKSNYEVQVTPQFNYLNQVNLGAPFVMNINPIRNTSNIIIGNPPVLTAPTPSPAVIYATNNGNESAVNGLIVVSDNPTLKVVNNCNGVTLKPHAANSCSIQYSVSTYTPGIANITYKDANNIPIGTTQVIWINQTPVPAIYITPNLRNVTVTEHVGTLPGSNIFTFSNVGNAPLESINFESINSSFTPFVVESNNCGNSILPGVQCTIVGHFGPSNNTTGILYYAARGKYDAINYNFLSLSLNYVVQARPLFTMTPSSVNMSLAATGNGESVIQTFIVKNIGSADGAFTALTLTNSNTQLQPVIESGINAGTCNSTTVLIESVGGIESSCTIVVRYGPASVDLTQDESGIGILNVNYKGGDPEITDSIQSTINYQLFGNDVYLSISGPDTTDLTGEGNESDPYRAYPGSVLPPTLTYTYKNMSIGKEMKNVNFKTNNLPYGYVIDPTSTCPSNESTLDLSPQQTCTLKLKLDKELLKKSPTGGTTVMNFESPLATWTTESFGFYKQFGPGSGVTFLTYLQPTIIFQLADNNTNFESVILYISASNESTVDSLHGNVWGEVDQFLLRPPVNPTGTCQVLADNSVTCDLKNNPNGSVTYIMPDYIWPDQQNYIPLVFSTNPGEFAYLNPGYTFINYVTSGQL